MAAVELVARPGAGIELAPRAKRMLFFFAPSLVLFVGFVFRILRLSLRRPQRAPTDTSVLALTRR